jgi:hypothetical protein
VIHHVGNEAFVERITGTEIDVEVAVVVEIAEIRAHRQRVASEALFCAHFLEAAATIALVELHGLAPVGETQIARCDVGEAGRGIRTAESSHPDVERAVVVEVEEPAGETADRQAHFGLHRDIREGAIALVVVETVGRRHVRDVEIREAIAIEVTPVHGLRVAIVRDAGCGRDVHELAGALVAVQLARRRVARVRLVADVEIEIAVVVVVPESGSLRREHAVPEPGLERDVREDAVAVVLERDLGWHPPPSTTLHADEDASMSPRRV